MNWRDENRVQNFIYEVTLFAGKYRQISFPVQTKRQVGLIKQLWQEDEPADGFRKVKVKRYDYSQFERYLQVIRFYEVEEKTAKVQERMFTEHLTASFILADLWERRGRALERRYAFRLWTPKLSADHKAKTIYDAPMGSILIGPAFQIGLSRKREWSRKFMEADDVPF